MSETLGFLDEPAFHLAPTSSATVSGCELLKQRLKASKQAAVAEAIGMDAGQLSHVMAGRFGLPIQKLGALLDELGLKLVDKAAQVIDERDFEAVTRAAGLLYTQAPHLLLKG